MRTFADDIEEEAGDEPIEAIVIGNMGWSDYNTEINPRFADVPQGKVLSWEAARPLLDFPYSTGYGAPECHAIYAWTATRVLFVSQYDGSTCLQSVPRNPIETTPEMPGG